MPPRSLPAAAFEDVGFWDARYAVDAEAFEWYEAPSISIAIAAINEALKLSSASSSAASSDEQQRLSTSTATRRFSLLDIGCGTSLLAERVAEEKRDSFDRVVACDASEVAIQKQRERQEERRRRRMEDDGENNDEKEEEKTGTTTTPLPLLVSYEVADAFALPYPDSSFDAVVDKGTADALDCAGREDSAARVIVQAARVLKAGGVFVLVSCRDKKRRFADFARANEMIATKASSYALVVSEVVGEIRKSALDPCPNAHVFVAVKAAKGEGGEEEEDAATTATEAARAVADAAALRAADAASASTAREA